MSKDNELLMTEGKWSLSESYLPNRNSTILHSCCSLGLAFLIEYIQRGSQNLSPAWRCSSCYEVPPSGILTVFILHNWEHLAE